MKAVLSIAILSIFLTSCRFGFKTVRGSGNVVTESRNIADFSKIDNSSSINVEIKAGSNYKVEVVADDNLMKYIKVEKRGDALEIEMKDNINIRTDQPITVKIEMPELREISSTGSGNIKSVGLISSAAKIETSLIGSGDIMMELNCPEIESSIAGSGNTIITGQTRLADVSIVGSGDFNSPNLKCEKAKVSIAGSGNVKVFASIDLDVSIVGSGDVYYAGAPKVSKSIVGSGDLKHVQ